MRKIALLAFVAVAAACGSSSSDPVVTTGEIRFGNLNQSYAAVDYCIKPAGGAYSNPIMTAIGGTNGLVYGSFGDQMISRYVSYSSGTYTVAAFNKTGGSCANPIATLDVTVGSGTKTLVALVGQNGVTGGTAALRSYADATIPDPAKIVVRFINAGFVPPPLSPVTIPIPAFDIGYTTPLVTYTTILTNVAYPTYATGPAGVVNGYASVAPSILSASTTLYSCSSGAVPPSPFCGTIALPSGFTATGGILASAFVIGNIPTQPNALFCGDNQPAPVANYPYSMCVSDLPIPAAPAEQ